MSFPKPAAVAVDGFYPLPHVDLAVERDGTAWIVWDDRRTKDRLVRLARANNGKLEQLSEPLGRGVTPAIDSDGSLVAMAWSGPDGLQVITRGSAAKDGYGSGYGKAGSGQPSK